MLMSTNRLSTASSITTSILGYLTYDATLYMLHHVALHVYQEESMTCLAGSKLD
jgi:hypothetical protein